LDIAFVYAYVGEDATRLYEEKTKKQPKKRKRGVKSNRSLSQDLGDEFQAFLANSGCYSALSQALVPGISGCFLPTISVLSLKGNI
jgi:hypothetical protein